MGSNPRTIFWMDIFLIYFVENLESLFEKTKINEKEAGNDPFL